MTDQKHKIYLAAKYSRREEMEALVPKFKNTPFEVNARWVFGEEEIMTANDIAIMDLVDVANSSAIMVFTHERSEPQPGGGRFVEMGYALALGNKVFVIGPIENVFCASEDVTRYDTFEDFLAEWSK